MMKSLVSKQGLNPNIINIKMDMGTMLSNKIMDKVKSNKLDLNSTMI